jgi:hypothetical protein
MKILFFVAAFFFLHHCMGQKNDYLVKVNGDTLWGSFQLKNKSFEITGTNSGKINAAEIKKIQSNKYKGNTVVECRLELYSDNYNVLETSGTKNSYVDTVMILEEILSTPKMDLYFGKSNDRTPFYFYKTPADSFPIQLIVRYHLDGGMGNYDKDPGRYGGEKSKVTIVEEKGFVNQLHAIMGDCGKIPEAMWELLAYRDYSLKQLIKKYNKCN